MKRWRSALMAALVMIWMLPAACAAAQELDGSQAKTWLEQFAALLPAQTLQNDPMDTVDPARAGQYLLEYAFGTVLCEGTQSPSAAEILEIDLRTEQVTDCRGMRVGMTLEQVLGGVQVKNTGVQLSVLGVQTQGIGWSWAYLGESGVYGVEFITYDMEDSARVKEYTLTYVLTETGIVSAIRLKVANSTQAQAEAGLATAKEIAARQMGEELALKNDESMFADADLTVLGHRALGEPVYKMVVLLGEPVQVQTLPLGGGRLLLYEGAAVQLGLNISTGEEIVLGVSVSGTGLTGPRGLAVGMSVQEAASLFRCDDDLYALGGTLYLEGEALGEPPYAELVRAQTGELTLRYSCFAADGRTALLEAAIADGLVSYWHLYYEEAGQNGL